MKTLIIDRKLWQRGEWGRSLLLDNETAKMCCLGFLALKCGATPDEMRSVLVPATLLHNLPGDRAKQLKERFSGLIQNRGVPKTAKHTSLCRAMMKTNDNPDIGDAERESMLSRMFAQIAWKIRFVDSTNASSVPDGCDQHLVSPGNPKG